MFDEEYLYCSKGDMYLSELVQEEILAALEIVEPRERVEAEISETTFSCPNCSDNFELDVDNDEIFCPNCGLRVTRTVHYHLKEFHFHIDKK